MSAMGIYQQPLRRYTARTGWVPIPVDEQLQVTDYFLDYFRIVDRLQTSSFYEK